MTLHKISHFDPDYKQYFEEADPIGCDLYSGDEKIGSVDDILVDEGGSLRYFVVHTGGWLMGKKTLLPIGRSRIDAASRRVYADGLSRTQVESLPEYNEQTNLDYEYEEQTRDVYRPQAAAAAATGAMTPDRYNYQQDADLYDLKADTHQNLKLYEERLIANKTRQKTGEVSIGKRVETESAKVSVPIEKERVVIERTAGDNAAVTPGADAFQSGEVARVEVYEETPDIHKETFVREEVNIRKEVDRETVEAQEQLRREELDINKDGQPGIDKDVPKSNRAM